MEETHPPPPLLPKWVLAAARPSPSPPTPSCANTKRSPLPPKWIASAVKGNASSSSSSSSSSSPAPAARIKRPPTFSKTRGRISHPPHPPPPPPPPSSSWKGRSPPPKGNPEDDEDEEEEEDTAAAAAACRCVADLADELSAGGVDIVAGCRCCCRPSLSPRLPSNLPQCRLLKSKWASGWEHRAACRVGCYAVVSSRKRTEEEEEEGEEPAAAAVPLLFLFVTHDFSEPVVSTHVVRVRDASPTWQSVLLGLPPSAASPAGGASAEEFAAEMRAMLAARGENPPPLLVHDVQFIALLREAAAFAHPPTLALAVSLIWRPAVTWASETFVRALLAASPTPSSPLEEEGDESGDNIPMASLRAIAAEKRFGCPGFLLDDRPWLLHAAGIVSPDCLLRARCSDFPPGLTLAGAIRILEDVSSSSSPLLHK